MAQFTAMDAVPATGRFDAEEIVDGAFATVRPQLVSNSRRVGCEWGVRWDAIARVARYAV